jgi:multidrug resistance efflux pump
LLSPDGHNSPFEYAFMNKGLLSDRRDYLVKQLAEAKHELEEKIAQGQVLKEKSERFQDLYKEGVVSRRELEEAEKEAVNSERDIQRYKANISELESRTAMIKQKLEPSAKQTEHKGVKLDKSALTKKHLRK